MEGDNNHDKDPEALAQAERELNATLERADMDNVFSTPQSSDNVKVLMTPGEDVIALLMRGDLPVDDAFAWAITTRIKKCRRHNDKEGERQILVFLAAKIGQAARRANLVSDTIIGEKQHTRGGGIGNWIREKAGLGDKE